MLQSKSNTKKWVVGNWKMHGNLAENALLLATFNAALTKLSASVHVVLCVPFPYLAQTQTSLQSGCIQWGAQDVSAYQQGAYTGEVAASMIAEFGAKFVIVGHSERRLHHRESDKVVAEKALRALEAELTPIVCVGETRAEHDHGHTHRVVGQQLQGVLDQLSAAQAANIIVAYEPVWAIGATQGASAHEAQAVHAFLRHQLAAKGEAAARVALLYGGSVKERNAAELFAKPDIDGGLIGSAALDKEAFLAICNAAASEFTAE